MASSAAASTRRTVPGCRLSVDKHESKVLKVDHQAEKNSGSLLERICAVWDKRSAPEALLSSAVEDACTCVQSSDVLVRGSFTVRCKLEYNGRVWSSLVVEVTSAFARRDWHDPYRRSVPSVISSALLSTRCGWFHA